MIRRPQDMVDWVDQMGFLPFFENVVPGFSVAEHTPPELWFSDDVDGPWEWKGPVIMQGGFAYGKFLAGKAMFVSMQWFPHLVNWRRSKARVTVQEQLVFDTIKQHKSLLTTQIRKLCGYSRKPTPREANPLLRASNRATARLRPCSRGKVEGMDTCLTHLQMNTLLVTADFEYKHDRQGRRYGWGVARYCTPEDYFGPEALAVGCTPQESRDLLTRHLQSLFPSATPAQIAQFIG